ncbi:ferritin-like domain-containing protein [Tropicibacter sp. S64]|uniref:ferritin-like domain-containing protein n=1 Tax=Tropicibacter sp. S64 TaxID=3415122 RepID=UPI003C7D1961
MTVFATSLKSLAALGVSATLLAGPAAAMSQQEAVLAALDDEYRAFAVYEAVLQKFGDVRPFSNIQKAEVTHAERLTAYAKANGIAVPENPYLGANLPEAPDTLAEACAIGVQAEIDNAGLYTGQLLPAAQGNAALTAIFTDLMNASQQQHLPAFQRCGGGGGMGQGKGKGGMGDGHGQGHGMGMGHGKGRHAQ